MSLQKLLVVWFQKKTIVACGRMNPCILQSLLFLASQMYFHVNNHRCTLNYLLFQFDQQDPSSVALALKMNSQKLNGRKIRVKPIETKHKQNARPVTISLKAFVINNDTQAVIILYFASKFILLHCVWPTWEICQYLFHGVTSRPFDRITPIC